MLEVDTAWTHAI